jgi:hypothetical protein
VKTQGKNHPEFASNEELINRFLARGWLSNGRNKPLRNTGGGLNAGYLSQSSHIMICASVMSLIPNCKDPWVS